MKQLQKYKADYIELSNAIILLYVKQTKDMHVFEGIGSDMNDPLKIIELIRKHFKISTS